MEEQHKQTITILIGVLIIVSIATYVIIRPESIITTINTVIPVERNPILNK